MQHTLFQDLNSHEFYIICCSSLEYPDYLDLKDRGFLKEICTTSKKKCKEKQEQIEEEIQELI
jgi:hypothetical protein